MEGRGKGKGFLLLDEEGIEKNGSMDRDSVRKE